MVELTVRRVMLEVGSSPGLVGGKGQNTGYEPGDAVCPGGWEERAVSTVMKDDEGPNQKHRRRNRYEKQRPVGPSLKPAVYHDRE